MPSDRFYKLKADKKERIVDASLKEFARVKFTEASINKIVKDADISRGSFYTYFEDKYDLLSYLLKDFGHTATNAIVDYLKKDSGDVFKMFEGVYDNMVSGEKTFNPKYDFIKMVFSDMNLINDSQILGYRDKLMYENEEYLDFCDRFYDNIDHKKFNLEKKSVPYVLELMMGVTFKAGVMSIDQKDKEPRIKQAFIAQLDLIKHGMIRQGEM